MKTLDFKNWLTSQYRSTFYENFAFKSDIGLHELKWILENTSRNDLGDGFYLEIKDAIVSRYLGEAVPAPTQPTPAKQWVYARVVKPLGELQINDEVGVSKARQGVWDVVHMDSNKRAFVSEPELAKYVKSVRNGATPIVAPSMEELRKVAAAFKAKEQPASTQIHADGSKAKTTENIPGRLPSHKMSKYNQQIEETFLKTNKNIVINALAGTGKAQPLDAKILTPSGWVEMGNIQIGDAVIGRDGKKHHVTGVFPQGMQNVFSVEFTDNAIVECSEDHLWFTETKRERVYCQQKGIPLFSYGSVKTTKEIADDITYKGRPKHYIPMMNPSHFPERKTLIKPYLMGVLLGDGCFRTGCVSYSSIDKEIVEIVSMVS